MPNLEDILILLEGIQEQMYLGMFMGGCPSGWSRQSQFDGRTVYGSTSYGATGGTSGANASSHTHSAGSYDTDGVGDHSHSEEGTGIVADSQSGTGAARIYEDSTSTGGGGAHSHNVTGTSGSGGDGGTNWPPYRAVVFCSP